MTQDGKIIIHIDEGIDTTTALQLVQSVVARGKISNSGTQYCYHTEFSTDNYPENYHVSAEINDKSHVFKVWRYDE